MCTQKMRALSYIGAEKITFPLNLTDRHTFRRTDISVYRVASLLLKKYYLSYLGGPELTLAAHPRSGQIVLLEMSHRFETFGTMKKRIFNLTWIF